MLRALILVIVVAALGMVGVGLFLNSQQTPANPAAPELNVIVAAKDIPTGTLVMPEMLNFAPPPANAKVEQLFERQRSPDEGQQHTLDQKIMAELSGAVARHRIAPGEPLVRDQMVKPGDSGFLAAVLTPGSRAVTIAVNAVTGTGGLIYPGDRVDVILTQTFGGQDTTPLHRSVSETIAHNVRVLAIDQQLQAKASPSGESKLAQTATLEVLPRVAEQIAVAGKLGDLSLVIRSSQDGEAGNQQVGAVWADDVSKALKMHAAEVPRDKDHGVLGFEMRLIHGDRVETVTHDR